MQLLVVRDFRGDRLKMLLDLLQMLLNPALMLFEQLQAFGYGLLTLAQEFSIALDIANRHPCCSQALEKLNPGHMLVTIGAVAIPLISVLATPIIRSKNRPLKSDGKCMLKI